MQLASYRPFDVLSDFDALWNRMANYNGQNSEYPAARRQLSGVWAPLVDIKEEPEHYVVSADLPGIDPKEVEVTFEDGVLTLSGERKHEANSEENGYRRVERAYGSFSRQFRLPEHVDAENISASGKNGVLEIRLPKKEQAKPRRIEIN